MATAAFNFMNDATKTRTKPLSAKTYISDSGELNLTRLVDDAVEALAGIRYNGYGEGNQRRSQRVVRRSFREVMVKAGYTERQANETYENQVLAINALAINAEE
jgi:hypothetical protein